MKNAAAIPFYITTSSLLLCKASTHTYNYFSLFNTANLKGRVKRDFFRFLTYMDRPIPDMKRSRFYIKDDFLHTVKELLDYF